MPLTHARFSTTKGFMVSVYITKKVLKLKKKSQLVTLRPLVHEVDAVLKINTSADIYTQYFETEKKVTFFT